MTDPKDTETPETADDEELPVEGLEGVTGGARSNIIPTDP
jgi:hypothetical protein